MSNTTEEEERSRQACNATNLDDGTGKTNGGVCNDSNNGHRPVAGGGRGGRGGHGSWKDLFHACAGGCTKNTNSANPMSQQQQHGGTQPLLNPQEEANKNSTNWNCIRYYLEQEQVDMTFQHPEYMSAPIFEAIRNNQVDIVRLLIQHYYNIGHNNNVNTMNGSAIGNANTDHDQVKKTSSTRTTLLTMREEFSGHTPLEYALEEGKHDIVDLLLEYSSPIYSYVLPIHQRRLVKSIFIVLSMTCFQSLFSAILSLSSSASPASAKSRTSFLDWTSAVFQTSNNRVVDATTKVMINTIYELLHQGHSVCFLIVHDDNENDAVTQQIQPPTENETTTTTTTLRNVHGDAKEHPCCDQRHDYQTRLQKFVTILRSKIGNQKVNAILVGNNSCLSSSSCTTYNNCSPTTPGPNHPQERRDSQEGHQRQPPGDVPFYIWAVTSTSSRSSSSSTVPVATTGMRNDIPTMMSVECWFRRQQEQQHDNSSFLWMDDNPVLFLWNPQQDDKNNTDTTIPTSQSHGRTSFQRSYDKTVENISTAAPFSLLTPSTLPKDRDAISKNCDTSSPNNDLSRRYKQNDITMEFTWYFLSLQWQRQRQEMNSTMTTNIRKDENRLRSSSSKSAPPAAQIFRMIFAFSSTPPPPSPVRQPLTSMNSETMLSNGMTEDNHVAETTRCVMNQWKEQYTIWAKTSFHQERQDQQRQHLYMGERQHRHSNEDTRLNDHQHRWNKTLCIVHQRRTRTDPNQNDSSTAATVETDGKLHVLLVNDMIIEKSNQNQHQQCIPLFLLLVFRFCSLFQTIWQWFLYNMILWWWVPIMDVFKEDPFGLNDNEKSFSNSSLSWQRTNLRTGVTDQILDLTFQELTFCKTLIDLLVAAGGNSDASFSMA